MSHSVTFGWDMRDIDYESSTQVNTAHIITGLQTYIPVSVASVILPRLRSSRIHQSTFRKEVPGLYVTYIFLYDIT